jgi:hypothetical protein
MHFIILNEFLLEKENKKNGENLGTALGPFLAQGLGLLAQPSVHCGLASPRGAARALGGHRTQSQRGGTAGWYDGEGRGDRRPCAAWNIERAPASCGTAVGHGRGGGSSLGQWGNGEGRIPIDAVAVG